MPVMNSIFAYFSICDCFWSELLLHDVVKLKTGAHLTLNVGFD